MDLDASDAIANGGQAVLVTASHAVYHVTKSLSAPAAVVGYQFHHSGLHGAFMKIVTNVSLMNFQVVKSGRPHFLFQFDTFTVCLFLYRKGVVLNAYHINIKSVFL